MPSTAARQRFVEIDLLKGCAILWVFLIHAKALGDGPGLRYVVNRAVLLFVVVFGLNARLWWRDRRLPGDVAEWYETRARRILVPFWAALLVWWLLALWYRPWGIELHWWLPFVHLGGYTLDIGTGWFVTLILLLAALYPGIEAAVRRFGVWPVLAVAVAGELATAHLGGDPTERLSRLVFPPRFLGHVVFGVLLADRMGRLGAAAGASGAALWALCVLAREHWPGLGAYAQLLLDAPLAVALLAVLRPLRRVPRLAQALAWFGVSSWGLYLGQLLVHNAVVFRCGIASDLSTNLAACRFPFSGNPDAGSLDRWLYAGLLLVGALALVALGELLLRVVRRSRTPA